MKYFISASDSLEYLKLKLQKILNKPILTSSNNWHKGEDTLYKSVYDKNYREYSNLELFLTEFSDGGLCVGKIEKDKKFRLFDLRYSKDIFLIYPLLKNEKFQRFEIASLNLCSDLNYPQRTIPITDKDKVPKELIPYVDIYNSSGPKKVEFKGIKFAISQPIESPNFLKENWHIGYSKDAVSIIQPPGWYSGEEILSEEQINKLGLEELTPGKCMVCKGSSNESKHLCIIKGSGKFMETVTRICLKCLKNSIPEWENLFRK